MSHSNFNKPNYKIIKTGEMDAKERIETIKKRTALPANNDHMDVDIDDVINQFTKMNTNEKFINEIKFQKMLFLLDDFTEPTFLNHTKDFHYINERAEQFDASENNIAQTMQHGALSRSKFNNRFSYSIRLMFNCDSQNKDKLLTILKEQNITPKFAFIRDNVFHVQIVTEDPKQFINDLKNCLALGLIPQELESCHDFDKFIIDFTNQYVMDCNKTLNQAINEPNEVSAESKKRSASPTLFDDPNTSAKKQHKNPKDPNKRTQNQLDEDNQQNKEEAPRKKVTLHKKAT